MFPSGGGFATTDRHQGASECSFILAFYRADGPCSQRRWSTVINNAGEGLMIGAVRGGAAAGIRLAVVFISVMRTHLVWE